MGWTGSDGSYVGALHNFRPTQEASYAGGSPSFVVNIGTVNGEGDGRMGWACVCMYVLCMVFLVVKIRWTNSVAQVRSRSCYTALLLR